jgi:hypothetical protein
VTHHSRGASSLNRQRSASCRAESRDVREEESLEGFVAAEQIYADSYGLVWYSDLRNAKNHGGGHIGVDAQTESRSQPTQNCFEEGVPASEWSRIEFALSPAARLVEGLVLIDDEPHESCERLGLESRTAGTELCVLQNAVEAWTTAEPAQRQREPW